MKKIVQKVYLLFHFLFLVQIVFCNDCKFQNIDFFKTDSINNMPQILPGGFLLASIENIVLTPKIKKPTINYSAPIIVFGTGMLMMSKSMQSGQTDWRAKNIPGFYTSVDDFTAFVPNIASFGLDLVGIKAKNNLKDRLLISALANGIMFSSVNALKYITKIKRPDNSSNNSFPSGHTALAFTGAQIIHEEYAQHGIGYSIGGYAIAGTTGFLRIANNRHWMSDVIAGAGLGMLSTKLSYKLLPWAKKKIYKAKNIAVIPNYYPKGGGLSLNYFPK